MSKIRKRLRELQVLWVAVSLTGYSARQEDIDDALDFVVSMGDQGIAQFLEELLLLHELADTTGLSATLASVLGRDSAQAAAPESVRLSIEDLATTGLNFFASCVENPQLVTAAGLLDRPLRESLQRRIHAQAGVLPETTKFENVAPLRADGTPWLTTTLGVGVGIGVNRDWPFNDEYFASRFEKAAACCSQDRAWLDLRRTLRCQEVDVTVEYWRNLGSADEPWVKRLDAKTIEVFVPRALPLERGGGDALVFGAEEADKVMAQVWDLASSRHEKST